MKKPFIFILLLSFSVVIVSVVSSLLLYSDIDETKESVKNKIKKTQEITYEKIDKDDPIINVYDVDENKIKKMNMEEYLYGVLSSEMPSTFDEEALKAQAVAARTYVIYKTGVMEEVRRMFKPEFLNRIDEIMVFHSLNKENIRKIVTILLKNLEKRCQEQLDIILKVTGAAKDLIADAGFDSKYGARPLRRAIQTKIEDEMATEILAGQIKAGDTVQVKVKDKKICFEVKDAEKA